MAYLITYDLNEPGQDYQELYDAIETLDSNALRIADSVWVIDHSGSAKEIRNFLRQSIDDDDRLIVFQCGKEAAWSGLTPAESLRLKCIL